MAANKGPSRYELFDLAIDELDRSIYKPNILSYKPYGAQVDFHQSDAFGRILTAGNRAGKTDAMVVEFIYVATGTHPTRPNPERWGHGPLQLRMIVVDVTKGVELIMIPKFKRWMTPSMMVDGNWDKSWDKNNLILTFANGSTIDFITYGMSLEKMGGVPRHLIGFDEEPPRDVFNEAMMRLMDFDGSWIIAATTINGMEWIYDLLVEPAQNGDLDDVKVFELDASKNPYLQTEERDKFMIGMDKEERQIREDGKYIARGGLVFPRFKDNLEAYVLPEAPDIVQMVRDGWAIYASVDHGWNNPTAWLWIAVNYVGECIVFAEHYQSEMTIAEHSSVVLSRESGWGLKPEDVIRSGDPAMKQKTAATGTSMIQSYAEHGIDINVEFIPHDVMVGVEKLQQYLALGTDGIPKLRISPNCPHLIRELKKLRWETYDSSKTAYSKNKHETIHKKDDHACDSLRYWATQMPDLAAQVADNGSKTSTTIGYTELIAKMREDDTITFAPDAEDEWEITESFGDYYEEGTYA